jgi:hypothetical protein
MTGGAIARAHARRSKTARPAMTAARNAASRSARVNTRPINPRRQLNLRPQRSRRRQLNLLRSDGVRTHLKFAGTWLNKE